jgi:hypothetical protein
MGSEYVRSKSKRGQVYILHVSKGSKRGQVYILHVSKGIGSYWLKIVATALCRRVRRPENTPRLSGAATVIIKPPHDN